MKNNCRRKGHFLRYKEKFKDSLNSFFKKERCLDKECKIRLENREKLCQCKERDSFQNFFEKKSSITTLANTKEDRVTIESINGGRHMRNHLYDIGIKKGDKVRLLSNSSGQCIIMAGDKRVTLCLRMAKLIGVTPSL